MIEEKLVKSLYDYKRILEEKIQYWVWNTAYNSSLCESRNFMLVYCNPMGTVQSTLNRQYLPMPVFLSDASWLVQA